MLFHGIALVAISAHPRLSQKRIAAGAMALGTLFFSGSLYALVLLKSKGKSGAQVLGPITPLGGTPVYPFISGCIDNRSHYAWRMGRVDSLRALFMKAVHIRCYKGI